AFVFYYFISVARKSNSKGIFLSVLILMVLGLPVLSSIRYFLPVFGFMAAIYFFSVTESETLSNENIIGLHTHEKDRTHHWYHWSRWSLCNCASSVERI